MMTLMLTILRLGTGYAIIALVVFAIGLATEQIVAVERQQSDTRLNVAYAMVCSFVRAGATTLLAGIPVAIGALGGGLIKLPSGGRAVALSIIVYIVAIDFAEYLFHRAQHAWPVLWALHSLHHSDPAVNVTTTTRHHWIDIFIKSIAVYPVVGLLLTVPYQAILINALVGHYNYFLHFNIKVSFGPLAALLNSPQYHRLHHSNGAQHSNKNFAALFPVFDLLFGTYCRPSANEYPATGIGGRQGPKGMLEAVAWPMIQ
jgi:sterol desaturase/sphingolipid hydroxylase (fatty acid hydroxylase superfamily)